MNSLPQVLRSVRRKAGRAPSAPALVFPALGGPTTTLTWSRLWDEIAASAARFVEHGVPVGHPMLILTSSIHEQVVAFLGGVAAGVLPSILSFPSMKQSHERFQRTFRPILAKADAKCVVRSDEFADIVDACDVAAIPSAVSPGRALATALRRCDDGLFLQFSSGTTGLRKGLVVTERMLEAQAKAFGKCVGLTPADCFVNWAPLYHDMGLVGSFLIPLRHGLTSVLMSPFEWLQRPDSYLRAVSAHGGTVSLLPNFAYSYMAERVDAAEMADAGVSLESLRVVINGSEPVRARTYRRFRDRFAPLGLRPGALVAAYGLAEATLAVTIGALGRAPTVDRVERTGLLKEGIGRPAAAGEAGVEVVSCGAPLDGTSVRIAGASGDRRVGPIEVRGPCVMEGGYYHAGGDAAPLTADGWLKTGDLGYLADGELYVTGRSKDLIIHRGVNLHPEDVEEVIGRVPGCRRGRAVVFGVADARLETESCVAMFERARHCADDTDDLVASVRDAVVQEFGVRLADARVVEVGTLLKTTSGKVSRGANRTLYLSMTRERSGGDGAADEPAAVFGPDGFAALLRRPESKDLVIQFQGGRAHLVGGVPVPDFLEKTGIGAHTVLMLRDKNQRYYQAGVSAQVSTFDQLVSWIDGIRWLLQTLDGVQRVHCLGVSMGAVAALLAGHALGVRNVWAFSPALPPDERGARLGELLRHVLSTDNRTTSYRVWYGAKNVDDERVAEQLGRCPGVSLQRVPTAKHRTLHALWQEDTLPRLLDPPAAAAPAAAAANGAVRLEDVIRLVEDIVQPGTSVRADTPLRGLMDSFTVTRLLAAFERQWSIRIRFAAVTNEDLRTARHLHGLVTGAVAAAPAERPGPGAADDCPVLEGASRHVG